VIRCATPDDLPALATALARAFDDDPVALFAHPGRRRRAPGLRRWFGGRLRTLLPEELVWCDADRRGAAIWAPPDRRVMPAGEVIRNLPSISRNTASLIAGFNRVERLHPHEPHMYLSVLGVEPDAQGAGLGSALLRPMLDRCDRDGIPAYLESSKESNVAFYARHGFRVTGEVRIPRGPRLWLMWREPA
jgi:ribosomal protein S18 acetylase RimI-like enzyme